ncbi:MAG: hypothetical protein KKD69_09185 [Euryarchaeota archaeon]|nr:hypothetical protein [Euryarchaeota archaeon]
MMSYIDYRLESVNLSGKKDSSISSCNLTYERNVKAIEKAMLTDGVWMLITNIIETIEPEEYRLGTEELIFAYKPLSLIISPIN